MIRDDDLENVNKHKKAFEVLESLSTNEKRQEFWEKILSESQAYSLTEWEYIFQGFNNEFFPEQYEPFVAPFFDSLMKLYTESSWNFFKKFYKHMFPRISEDLLPVIEKLEQILGTIVQDDVAKEGYERLAKLLMDSLEETRRRRSCFFVNNSQQDNLKGSFLEFLTPTLKTNQQNTDSAKELEENKLATQIVIDNLESIVKAEESTPEGHDVTETLEEEEEEEKVVINRSWKKHDTVKIQLTSTFFKDWEPNNKKKYSKMFKSDSKRFSLLEKQFAANQTLVYPV